MNKIKDIMAKTIEDLQKSREIREKVIAKYGCVPTSIIEPDYAWGKHVIELDSRKQQAVAQKKHEKMDYDKKLSKVFSMSSQNVRGKGAGLSTFPPDLCRKLVNFYSEPGDTVIDSSAGHNSRMQVCHELGRHYIGYDVCSEFMEFNRKVKDEITGKGKQSALFEPTVSITLREQSSEKMVEEDNTMDFALTSPPYWDIEYYDDHPQQLGYNKTYDEFLGGIKRVLSESYRVLKPNKYCAWNINDFRKKNILYPYHADIIRLMQEVGFTLWDCVIVKWQSCLGQCFASQIEERKMFAKSHEYVVTGKKVV